MRAAGHTAVADRGIADLLANLDDVPGECGYQHMAASAPYHVSVPRGVPHVLRQQRWWLPEPLLLLEEHRYWCQQAVWRPR